MIDALKQQIEIDAVISGLMRDENDSLKTINAELLEALEEIRRNLASETFFGHRSENVETMTKIAAKAIRKAKEDRC